MVSQPEKPATGGAPASPRPAQVTLEYEPKGAPRHTRVSADLVVALVIIGSYVVFFTCLGAAFVFGE